MHVISDVELIAILLIGKAHLNDANPFDDRWIGKNCRGYVRGRADHQAGGQPREEAAGEQPAHVGGQNEKRGADGAAAESGGQHRLAADMIGDRARHNLTDGKAEQVDRQGELHLRKRGLEHEGELRQ